MFFYGIAILSAILVFLFIEILVVIFIDFAGRKLFGGLIEIKDIEEQVEEKKEKETIDLVRLWKITIVILALILLPMLFVVAAAVVLLFCVNKNIFDVERFKKKYTIYILPVFIRLIIIGGVFMMIGVPILITVVNTYS